MRFPWIVLDFLGFSLSGEVWLHMQVACQPQCPFQLGDSDLHSLYCTSLFPGFFFDCYTRLMKQTNAADFPDAIILKRVHSCQGAEY